MIPESETDPVRAAGLRFHCENCRHELEAPLAYAGVEGPCPVCGTIVRAPLAAALATGPPIGEVPVAELAQDRSALRDCSPHRGLLMERAAERGGAASDRLRGRGAALVWGILALGGAAAWLTSFRQSDALAPPPELSRQVVDRMQQVDRQRDEAVQAARSTLEALRGAADAVAAADMMLPGSAAAPELRFPCLPGVGPDDFEFIQARRIPGTDRFLMLFEIAADPPLVVPVEQTAGGTKVHGWALAQQQGGQLGPFLRSQGPGEGVFYVLLRPATPPQAAERRREHADLATFQWLALEPAFPADAAAPCLVCLNPDSPAGAIFAARLQDPSLLPAVVQLSWRQPRESGSALELRSFQPNAWSRH